MKRKLCALVLAVLLVMLLPVQVLAEETAAASTAVRAAYWTNNTLYTFAHFPQCDAPEETDVSLMINNQTYSSVRPASLQESDGTAHWLFLVDRSLSMSTQKNRVTDLIKEAMKTRDTELKVTVATFDLVYQTVAEDLTDWNKVQSALWSITHNREESDICGAAAKALEHLGEDPCKAGDVSNLVIITDGKSWYSEKKATQAEKAAQAAQSAKTMMAAYPEITVHTVCFGSWEQEAGDVLTAGRGLHRTVSTSPEARKIGRELAEYSDSLYAMAFPVKGYDDVAYITDNVTVRIGMDMTGLGTVRNLGIQAPGIAPAPSVQNPVIELVPQDPAAEATEPATEATEPAAEATEPAGEAAEPAGEATDPTGEATEPTGEATDPTGEAMEPTSDDTDPTEGGEPADPEAEKKCTPLWLIVLLSVVGLGAVILAVVLLKNRRPADAVRMRVDVISGNVSRIRKDYYLTDQILIGTDKKCHIVVDDPAVLPVNTRIFKQGQMIYIEDMNSNCGTLLGGMRIYSSNRLRSGDDIIIGSVTLRILF